MFVYYKIYTICNFCTWLRTVKLIDASKTTKHVYGSGFEFIFLFSERNINQPHVTFGVKMRLSGDVPTSYGYTTRFRSIYVFDLYYLSWCVTLGHAKKLLPAQICIFRLRYAIVVAYTKHLLLSIQINGILILIMKM